MLENIKLRSVTTFIGLPILGLMVWLGGYFFSAIIAIISVWGTLEICLLCSKKGFDLIKSVAVCLAIGIVLITHSIAGLFPDSIVLGERSLLLTTWHWIFIVIVTCYSIWQTRQIKSVIGWRNSLFTLFAGLCPAIFLSYMILIRIMDEGLQLIFFLLTIIWVADTLAYIVGSLWGKHKLMLKVPSTQIIISPNKTWEGLIAGISSALVVAVATYFLDLISLNLQEIIFLTLILVMFGVIGDLVESSFKRLFGAKDSGSLLPGHGGILDKVDSFVLNAIIMYYYLIWIVL